MRSPRLLFGLSAAFVVLLVGAAEGFWRAQGHRPSVVDSEQLWSAVRGGIGDGWDELVLLGSSRMQLGLDLATVRERLPGVRASMLAVDGRYPMATLRHLAEDESFRGTVWCATTEDGFLRDQWDAQQAYVDAFRTDESLTTGLEATVTAALQSRLVVLNPKTRLDAVLRDVLRRQPLPRPTYLVTRLDRTRLADYSRTDIAAHRAGRVRRSREVPEPASPEDWLRDVAFVDKWVQAIERRGGRVVFIRFPTSGPVWKIDERRYPKAAYWDRLDEATTAATLHFRDVPAMQQFELPDYSHLDERDRQSFTASLLDALDARGILRDRP